MEETATLVPHLRISTWTTTQPPPMNINEQQSGLALPKHLTSITYYRKGPNDIFMRCLDQEILDSKQHLGAKEMAGEGDDAQQCSRGGRVSGLIERGINVPSFSPTTLLTTVLEMAYSSNVYIDKGTFNSAQGDIHIHNGDPEFGLHTLKLGVSLGAVHDSADRCPAPNCHPGTRDAVRQIILDWIRSESWDSSFFWLYGPAGAGKTAILQAIAEFLCSQSGFDENFGGSFFFSRGKTGRDQGHFLFSTIAYQLALNDVTGLRQHVNRIMKSNPTLHTKSMDVQVQALIVDPFKYLLPRPRHSYLVIIDGLDECHDKAAQQSILRLLCETITVHRLPLRFLIGSRPESHIRAGFDQESLYTITHRVVLDDTFNPGRDIRVFLKDGFAKICADNSIMSHVGQPWPNEGIIDLLVQRSSGQFIYAATVLKFVGADFCSPTDQLALVLKPDPAAFSDLDHLYTQILSAYPNAVNIVQVLGIIIAFYRKDLPEVIEDILGMQEGKLKLVLRGLSSLMKDEKDEKGERLRKGVVSYVIPHFAHASFSDYLFDSSRSGQFHVNQQEYENQITIRSFALIMQSIRSSRRSSATRVLHVTTWDYFTSRLPDRFIHSPNVVKEAIITDINDLVHEFWRSSRDGAVEAPLIEMRRLLEILQNILPMAIHNSLDDQIRAKFKILVDGYRKMFDQSLSKSKDLGDILRFLPGVVVQKQMSMQEMSDLYRIKPALLERLIKSTIEPLRPSHASPNSRYILDNYLSGFLQHRDRSHLYYCDPIVQHIFICRHFLSFLDGSNAFDLQSHGLADYASFHFYNHLCGATSDFLNAQKISDDGAIEIEILHDLETIAYYVDNNPSVYLLRLLRRIIRDILRWANMLTSLKGVAISVPNIDLMDRVCHLTNKIYREMLCITRQARRARDGSRREQHLDVVLVEVDDDDERMTYITLGRLDNVEVSSAFSWTPQYRIVLFWNLLDWIMVEGRIPCSFTNFITTPELSGPFYISPDVYHTQITEYLLERIYHQFSDYFLIPDLRLHLCRALPTKMIFYLLRSIPSGRLIRHFGDLKLDTLEVINKWLQGLGSERPSDLYDRFQGELLQHKMALTQL